MDDDYVRKERAIEAALAEHRGEKLSGRQKADLAWWKQSVKDEVARQVLRDVPKKLYCDLSGRQVKVINEQAKRYGLPLEGASLDLFVVITAFHDFLAENAKHLSGAGELRALKIDEELANLRRRGQLLDIEFREKEARWVDRGELKTGLSWLVGRLQQLAERIGAFGGPECQRQFNDLLEEIAAEMEVGHLNFGENGEA